MTYTIKNKNGELMVSDQMLYPYMRKPVLMYRTEKSIRKLASFKDKDAMMEFLRIMGAKEV